MEWFSIRLDTAFPIRNFNGNFEAPKEQTVPDPFGEISVMVRVTNTGKRAGQDVIQLYVSPPYTRGIEKSSVALAAYAKTSLLEPGSL